MSQTARDQPPGETTCHSPNRKGSSGLPQLTASHFFLLLSHFIDEKTEAQKDVSAHAALNQFSKLLDRIGPCFYPEPPSTYFEAGCVLEAQPALPILSNSAPTDQNWVQATPVRTRHGISALTCSEPVDSGAQQAPPRLSLRPGLSSAAPPCAPSPQPLCSH